MANVDPAPIAAEPVPASTPAPAAANLQGPRPDQKMTPDSGDASPIGHRETPFEPAQQELHPLLPLTPDQG